MQHAPDRRAGQPGPSSRRTPAASQALTGGDGAQPRRRPFIRAAAVVQGMPAYALSQVLRAAHHEGLFAFVPAGTARDQVLDVVRAIDDAGAEWAAAVSDHGNSEGPKSEAVPPLPDDDWLTADEAAALCGVSTRRMRQLANELEGLGRRAGPGRQAPWLFSRAAVTVLADQRSQEAAP